MNPVTGNADFKDRPEVQDGVEGLDGVVISLNTPFTADDQIDFAAVERAVEWHLAAGAVGFLAPAQAGEVLSLSRSERLDLLRCLRELTRGRAALIVGATAREEAEGREIAAAAIRIGCDYVLSEIPPRRTREEIHRFCARLAGLGIERLMLQDLDFHGTGTAVDLIVELAERIEPFRWLKLETTPAGPKYSAVLEASPGLLHVSGGWASMQLIEALDRGVRTFMVTDLTASFARALARYAAGERAAAWETFAEMLPVLAFTRQHLDVSIHFHKQLMYRRGIFATPCVRQRTIPWDQAWQRCADELIDRLLAAESRSREGH